MHVPHLNRQGKTTLEYLLFHSLRFTTKPREAPEKAPHESEQAGGQTFWQSWGQGCPCLIQTDKTEPSVDKQSKSDRIAHFFLFFFNLHDPPLGDYRLPCLLQAGWPQDCSTCDPNVDWRQNEGCAIRLQPHPPGRASGACYHGPCICKSVPVELRLIK